MSLETNMKIMLRQYQQNPRLFVIYVRAGCFL